MIDNAMKMPCHIDDADWQTPAEVPGFDLDDSDAAAEREMQEHCDRYLGILEQPEVQDIAYSNGGLKRFWDREGK